MMAKKYIVKNPWHGVKKGDVIETDKLHPAVKPHVDEAPGERKMVVNPDKGDQKKKSDDKK